MCHGFLAVGDTGERLSHAVGCAFAICLDKKQQREKESANDKEWISKAFCAKKKTTTSLIRDGTVIQPTLMFGVQKDIMIFIQTSGYAARYPVSGQIFGQLSGIRPVIQLDIKSSSRISGQFDTRSIQKF